MEKPDVDSIEGLSPAISIEQRTTSKNPRSTVGTVTEIYDYLRLLYASVGKPHCPKCGRPIQAQTIQEMVDRALRLPDGSRFSILAPYVAGKKGEYRKQMAEMVKEGIPAGPHRRRSSWTWTTRRSSTSRRSTRSRSSWTGSSPSRAEDEDYRKRLADSIETATRVSGGLVILSVADGAGRGPLRQLRLPRLRHVADRDHAAALLVQLALRRVPRLLGPRHHPQGGPRAARRRPRALHRERGDRDPEAGLHQLAVPSDGDAREALQVPARPALLQAPEGGAEGHPLRLRGATRSSSPRSPRRGSTTGGPPSRGSSR